MSFSKEFIEVFEYLAEKLGIAIDWSSKNVMPYLEELCGRIVKYETDKTIGWLVVSVVFLIIGIVYAVQIYKHKEWGVTKYPSTGDDKIARTLMYFASGMIMFLAIVAVCENFEYILECIYIPEMVTYEYIQKIMQNF